ncbi:PepSY-like domain-containing protein [Sphingobacterium sp. JB170]|uniref:PepSY-like domain-containing protein n=1 Tax=Sphingobacterium sp. JB170 TaxID=1434842 RepID=UPI00097EFA92|nr:PepSY-like domain-containing protein [Sphingobacterium sp. JB170]SJN43570.1 Putative exported protein [Sphingobacterium sp. JB170]
MGKYVKGIVAVAVTFLAINTQAQEKAIAVNQMPPAAQEFVKKHYDVKSVSYVILEDERFSGKEYKVAFTDGTELEFDSKGRWTEIDAQRQAVPAVIVPENIRNYVNQSFPNNKIVQISRSSRKYEVELTSGLDLDFDRNGEFVRIDD